MSRAKGDLAEARALKFLQQAGFIIVSTNYYSRFGEIDIIARRDGVLHFIEVKSAPTYEQAIANITPTKLEKITKTVAIYLKQAALDINYCIDALIVSQEGVELVENITL